MRRGLLLLPLALSAGCVFDYERGVELEPGDVHGRALRGAADAAPYAEVAPSGTGRALRTDAQGEFLLRGLSPGGYSVRVRDDADGDGWPERTAERAFAITVQEHADGLFGTGESTLTYVLLGDIELGPVVQVSGAVTLNGQPRPGAKVFVWAKRALPGASLGGGVEQTDLVVDAEAEAETAADGSGRFRFDALAAGELTFTAFWLDETTGEEHSSEPFTLDAPAGATLDVADLELSLATLQAPPPAAPVERDVQLELSPEPSGTVSVRLERADIPAEQRTSHHLYEADFPASRTVVIRPPVGAWRVFVEDAEQRRVFTSVHVAPPGDEPVLWRLHLDERDPCDLDEDGVRDCDGDELAGLPEIESWDDAEVAAAWAPCASACGALFGDELLGASCEVGGETYDCDDDGDGQPDVTEHYDCYGLFLGRDLDGDGLCDPVDPYPQCAANDPDDPSCAYDNADPFVPPPPRGELDGGVTDAGPAADAGFDAGTGDGGARDAGFDGGVPFDAGPVEVVSVEPLYPNNGDNWNTHVRNDGDDLFTASDTACDGTETGRYDDVCLHGGELKVVEITSRDSCAGLSGEDSLQLFEWVCDDSGGTVRFVSTGLAPGKGLVDAVDFSAGEFLRMQFWGFDSGGNFASSPMLRWWTNPVVLDNDGMVQSEAVAGTVYLITAAMPSEAYFLDADNMTVLINPATPVSGLLAWTGSQSYPFDASGALFLWMEGAFEGVSQSPWLGAVGPVFPRLRRLDCVECEVMVAMDASVGLLVDNARISGDGSGPAYSVEWNSAEISTDIVMRDLRLTECNLYLEADRALVYDVDVDNSPDGLEVYGPNGVFVDYQTANTQGPGLVLGEGGGYVVASNSVIGANETAVRIDLTQSANRGGGTVTAVTSFMAAALGGGLWLNGAVDSEIEDVLAVGNFSTGIRMDGAERNVLENILSAQNFESSVQVNFGADNKFTGVLKVGGDYNVLGVCEDDTNGGGGDGIVHMTCTDDGTNGSSTYTGHLSDAVLTTGVDVDQVIVGRVSADDTAQPYDDAGVVAYPDQRPWETQGSFEHRYRGIASVETQVLGNSAVDFAGFCADTDCQIWDLALRATDTEARNINPLPTGNDTRVHRWWLEPAAGVESDCDVFPGATFNMIDAVCETVHLKHAWERIGDRIGNDNGLCESNEHCMWSRNLGAYQGHGALVSAGAFTDGTLTGITLWTWSENGY